MLKTKTKNALRHNFIVKIKIKTKKKKTIKCLLYDCKEKRKIILCMLFAHSYIYKLPKNNFKRINKK